MLAALRQGKLFRNTLWMLGAHGGRMLVAALYFVLLARSLGVEKLGAFAGTVALVNVLAPFAGLGVGNLLVMHVSRNPAVFAGWWGNALLWTVTLGAVLTAAVWAFGGHILPAACSGELILLLGVADLCFSPLVDRAGQAFQAVERLSVTAKLLVMANGLRLLAVAGFAVRCPSAPVEVWAMWYLGAAIVGALISVATVMRVLGTPRLAHANWRRDFVQGFYFSISLSAKSVYTDIDKTMLTRLSNLEGAGIYTAAYRIINMAITPINALLSASCASFFRAGQHGIGEAASFTFRLLRLSVVYGIASAVGLWVVAPLLPLVLGQEYTHSVAAMRWLALVPCLQAVHYLFADALMGAGYQGVRSAVQVGVAMVNILLNLWLIPVYSWRGAAWATLACEAMLAVCLLATIGFLKRRESATQQRTNA